MITEMEKWRDLYFKDKGTKYKNHVNKFIDYLKYIKKSDTPNNISIEDVTNCVGHYVKRGVILSVSSMELHLESLKNFYDYLLNTGKSRDIFSQMNYEKYKNNLSDTFQLAEKVSRGTFSVETMKDILSKLDSYLDIEYSSIKGPQLKQRYIHFTVLNLFIKLTLIAPAKRQIIGNLKYSDFSENIRKVNVNDVEVSVPNALRHDLKKAFKLGETIQSRPIKEDEQIFKYIINNQFTEERLNSWFCTFIKEQNIVGIDDISKESKTYAIEPVMKTAISNLVKSMANLAYVSKVTGTKIATLEETYYTELFELNLRQPSIGESIDWQIRKSSYYSYI
ncbi:site-specific integrase [Clostridium hydrogenum]|uniref:site-specific integrase n=1 Tax=Clostridium hydrogenum TaxID=2855764 RepID=UPI001F1C11B9|nr:site-specific integrase [Clostridium hydrogenum]